MNTLGKTPEPKNQNPDSTDIRESNLIKFFETSFTPRDQWKIGFEYETSGIHQSSLLPILFDGEKANISDIMAILRKKHGENCGIWENNYCFGLNLPYGRITLEPGGQIEFSSDPLEKIEEANQVMECFLKDLYEVGEKKGLAFYSAGVDPFQPISTRPWSKKERYKVMRSYLGTRGRYAHHMMQQTMSIQYNIDFSDETDALKKYHAGIALFPLLQWLSSNSKIYEQTILESSFREQIWKDMDPDRSGLPPQISQFQDYIEYALDVPMFFILRDQKPIVPQHHPFSFRTFMKKGLKGFSAQYHDWELHLSTLFPEVRFKKNALELRMFDGNSPELVEAFLAVVAGIFYHEDTLEIALNTTWEASWVSAKKLVQLAQKNLTPKEQLSLAPLVSFIQSEQLPADQMVKAFRAANLSPQGLLKHLKLRPKS